MSTEQSSSQISATGGASSGGSGGGGVGRVKSYALLKLLSSGTYTTGTDWRTQFAGASVVAAPATTSGEILYPGSGTAFGVYLAYAFRALNPFDQQICIPEASSGAPVQVYMNGVRMAEVTAAGMVTCSAIGGLNVFEVIRPQAPLVVIPSGPFFGASARTSAWTSLYPAGADPFNPTSGSGSDRGTESDSASMV